jgi:hypothetical protein
VNTFSANGDWTYTEAPHAFDVTPCVSCGYQTQTTGNFQSGTSTATANTVTFTFTTDTHGSPSMVGQTVPVTYSISGTTLTMGGNIYQKQ